MRQRQVERFRERKEGRMKERYGGRESDRKGGRVRKKRERGRRAKEYRFVFSLCWCVEFSFTGYVIVK
jgi:hypothetical protein